MPLTSMVTILHRGYIERDRHLLPDDEFAQRWRALQQRMGAAGLAGVFVFGDADESGDGGYLGGTLDGATVFVPAVGDPILLGGSDAWREQSVLRLQTAIADFRVEGTHASTADAIAAIVAERDLAARRVGTVGLGRTHSVRNRDAAVAGLSACMAVAVDAWLAEDRASLRPREHRAIRIATGLAEHAAAAAVMAHRRGGSTAQALVAAERAARRGRARDLRLLADLGGEDLRPLGSHHPARSERLALYVAVDYQGYWGEAIVTQPPTEADQRAAATVAAQQDVLRAGVTAGRVADAALAALGPDAQRSASYGFGGGLGLSAADVPSIHAGSDKPFAAGAIVALRIVVPTAQGPGMAGKTVLVGEQGSTALPAIRPGAAG